MGRLIRARLYYFLIHVSSSGLMPTSIAGQSSHGPTLSSSEARVRPLVTQFLRPGARFEGSQITDNQVHDVKVEIKFADVSKSILSGYLCIYGLTAELPMLTTYFEGEIISPSFSFETRRPSWKADWEQDLIHWRKFMPFHQIQGAESRDYVHTNYRNNEYLFMRWKEYFLVPDHEQKVDGASYSGFYYICLNQLTGAITGYYYQKGQPERERFQSISLIARTDNVLATFEFR